MAHAPALHVLSHQSEHGRWEAVLREPDPRLASYVRRYQGYVEDTTLFERRREMPSGNVSLIMGFGPPVGVTFPRDPAQEKEYRGVFVAGLSDTYAISETGGRWRGVQIDFTPIGAYLFFGLPMDAIANRAVELVDILGPAARRLTERLAEAPSWEARFALLDSTILTRLAEAPAPAASVVWAWGRIRETSGNLRIGDLAAEIGWSRKHLASRFREHIGLPPKKLARIFRFNRVLRELDRTVSPKWADVAYDCGYYDQAHFIRDFQRFAGSTPNEYLRRRLPDGGGVVGD